MYVTDNATFTFDVGFTSVRPVIPDQHHAFVTSATLVDAAI
jgi:hypothetical protein